MSTIIKIQHLRGTAAQWTNRNPVLPEGEIGVETDTEKIKVGNGTDTWSELSYIGHHVSASVSKTEQAITWTYDGSSEYTFAWTHNLGSRPIISVIDSAGSEVEVELVHDTVNQLTIKANTAFTGGTIIAI